ncbi:MAG: glycosyltransferase family 4 protein [Candidatus Eremiobacteraeota bacterium]|nr:glycosyltransferase family 4 protein [Candidatus Eremiobacteraeota bacterium]
MKIAVDAQLTVGTATGIGEYVGGLAGALRALGIDLVELKEPGLDPWRFDRRVIWDQIVLPRRARSSGADLLHCASGTLPLRCALPIVATVHDVAWLRVQAHARPYARYYFGPFALARYREAARIVVDSAFSRGELLELLGDFDAARVEAVYPGVANDFCALERGTGDGRTILAVGTVERRKNLELLVRCLPALRHARIVSVGPSTPYRGECEALARKLGVQERLEFRGYVARRDLLSLYASCAVVALPSRYEGFGYPAAQALCAGTPCVVSDRSSLPEVAGGDATVVALDDAAAWTGALAAAMRGDDDARAAKARSRAQQRFAWTASARAMVRIYEASVGG